MKGRYFFVGLVALSAVLAYTGVRYQAKRRVELTAQLKEAVHSDEIPRAIHLLKMGADTNAKESDGTPLIFSALDIEKSSLLKAFIAAGANVNSTHREDGETLTLLSKVGHYAESLYPAQIQEMKMLLDAGANPNLGSESVLNDNAGGCGSCGACWSNPQEVALLLKHGAKPRKDDAVSILQTALFSDEDALLHEWKKVPFSTQERRTALVETIKLFSDHDPPSRDDQALKFLRHELRAMSQKIQG